MKVKFRCNCGFTSESMTEAWLHLAARLAGAQPWEQNVGLHTMIGTVVAPEANVAQPTSPSGDTT